MKKFTDFLEKNVQWVTIALGAAYLLWMVYSYVLNSAAWTVNVGGEAKTPGDVDETVVKTFAQPLKDKMEHGSKVDIRVPSFDNAINLSTPSSMPAMTLAWVNSPTRDVSAPQAIAPVVANNPNAPVQPGVTAVVQLPAAPAATDLETATGRSSVVIPPPVVLAADGTPVPPAAAAAEPVSGVDTDWVTVSYKISVDDLAKEFQRTNIPPQPQFSTCFLNVDLVREELVGENTWSPETIVAKLTTATQPKFPDAKANRQEMQTYVNWAVKDVAQILQPTFYSVLKGDLWTLAKDLVGSGVAGGTPEAPVLNLGPNDVRPGFDPANPPNPAVPPLTRKEKYMVAGAAQAKRDKEAAEKVKANAVKNATPRAGPGGGPSGPPGRPGSYAPQDAQRPLGQAQPPRGGYQGGGAPPGMPPGYRGPPPQPLRSEAAQPQELQSAAAPQPQQPAAPQAPPNFSQLFPLPTDANFDPRVLSNTMNTITGWAHDASAQPGKTYRYKIRYKIKNPIWGSNNVAKQKALADQFSISSAESDWTVPVTVPSVVSFFFYANRSTPQGVPVEIFRWQDGQLHSFKFQVSAGDIVGGSNGGIDYSTGFTLVDLRQDIKSDNTTIWLLTPEGILVKHEVKSDLASPQYQQLKQQLQATPPAAAGAGPGAAAAVAGAPAMINPTR